MSPLLCTYFIGLQKGCSQTCLRSSAMLNRYHACVYLALFTLESRRKNLKANGGTLLILMNLQFKEILSVALGDGIAVNCHIYFPLFGVRTPFFHFHCYRYETGENQSGPQSAISDAA